MSLRGLAFCIALASSGVACTETIRVGPLSLGDDASVNGSDAMGGRPPSADARHEDAACEIVPLRPLEGFRALATVVFALDRSASMLERESPSGKTRLELMHEAVLAAVGRWDRAVLFGLEEFPSPGFCGSNGCCASEVLPPDRAREEAIREALFCRSRPSSCANHLEARPTGEALARVRAYFKAVAPFAGDRHVVVVTAGSPTCAIDGEPCNSTIENAGRLANEGVRMSLFDFRDGSDACLDEVAEAAGTVRVPVPRGEALKAGIETLAEGLAKGACELILRNVPDDPELVIVRINNQTVPRDSGWAFEGGSTTRIVVKGTYCAELQRTSGVASVWSGCRACPGQTCP